MTELTNIATIRAHSGKSESLGAALTQLIAPTRAEAGCRAYQLHRGAQDRDIWMVYERWGSQADADAHLAQPYVQKFIGRLGDLVAGPIDVQSYVHISA